MARYVKRPITLSGEKLRFWVELGKADAKLRRIPMRFRNEHRQFAYDAGYNAIRRTQRNARLRREPRIERMEESAKD